MNLKTVIKKSINMLENQGRLITRRKDVPSDQFIKCPECHLSLTEKKFSETEYVCPDCGYHMRINARKRLSIFADEGSFLETNADLESIDFLNFPGYKEKLSKAEKVTREKEAVITGTCTISGIPAAIFIMNPDFMMGSMGSVVGEKITSLFELAEEKNLPVVGFSASGGARMQEGIISLMQMAKVSAAVRRHSLKGLFYLSVLTDPTTGGVTASFAMEGDVITAEPGALVGFAGPRVIEDTIKKKLPEGFQKAENILSHGFIDSIVSRRYLKGYIRRMLSIHGDE